MTAIAEQILRDALRLPPVDRATLIERLFRSFDSTPDEKVDAAWSDEMESRIAAYDAGEISAAPAEEVLDRLNKK